MSVYQTNDEVADHFGMWEPCAAASPDVVTPSESTTGISGGFYRTVSDSGLDTQQPEFLDDNSNLRTSLHLQLNSMRPSKHFVSNVSRMIGEMKTVVTTYLDGSANLVPYGSIASNLILDDSSVDILVFIPPEVFAAKFYGGQTGANNEVPLGLVKEYEVRQSMKKALLKIGELFTVFCGLLLVKVTSPVPLHSVTPSSRVPVLTMVDPISNVRFEIVCNHVLPLFSTRLVKAYNSLSPTGEFRDFVLLIKRWATQKNLVGGALSGFAWTLMCIYYCQTALGLFPTLQGLSLGARQQWTDPFGSNRRCDVGFQDGSNMEPVMLPDAGSMFIGFFEFYGNYWDWKTGVISVRLGRLATIDNPDVYLKQSPVERTHALFIEDPFDIKKDVCHGASIDRARNEIIEACELLSMGNSPGSLMTAKSNRRRQQRADSSI